MIWNCWSISLPGDEPGSHIAIGPGWILDLEPLIVLPDLGICVGLGNGKYRSQRKKLPEIAVIGRTKEKTA